MTFTGTLDKCNACDKTVYFVDLLTADGITYHKSCFKCTHCKGTLVMSNYSSMDGVLYCKTHFEQLFKECGNFSKNFQTGKSERPSELTRAPSKLSSMFSGTLDKCSACQKTVYPLEKVTMEEEIFHKQCFRCAHAGCPLTHSSYASLDGTLYCKVHFAQLFMVKGTYSHFLEVVKQKTAAHEVATDKEANEQLEAAEDAEVETEEHSEESENKQEDEQKQNES
ncbi:unnamed protein product [Rhodiola kirilowii]